MFFILSVFAVGHLRRNAFTFRNDSQSGSGRRGMNDADLKIDETNTTSTSNKQDSIKVWHNWTLDSNNPRNDVDAQEKNNAMCEPDESNVSATSFWNIFDETCAESAFEKNKTTEQTSGTIRTNETNDLSPMMETTIDVNEEVRRFRLSLCKSSSKESKKRKKKKGKSKNRGNLGGSNSTASVVSNPSLRSGSYILHTPCGGRAGVGATTLRLRKLVDVAVSQELGMVCQPNDWKSAEHHTGNVGDLFGCFSESHAEGEFTTVEDLCNDLSLVWEYVKINGTGQQGEDKTLYKIAEPVLPGRVYVVETGCHLDYPFGKGWRFFQSQYDLVRRNENRTGSSAVDDFSLVIHIRRGDGGIAPDANSLGRGYPPKTYLLSVEALLRLSSDDNSAETMKLCGGKPIERVRKIFGVVDNRTITISVLAETANTTEDAQEIVTLFDTLKSQSKGKISKTRYFFGEPLKDERAAKGRWVHDMDLAVTSDLFILSNSYFSSLAAAMQRTKRAFTLAPLYREQFSLPGMSRGKKETDGSIRINETVAIQPFTIE